jgi:fructose/tagatose bisphosphate aldolase
MTLVPFAELMGAAEGGGYAVGYFESWSMESLLAVASAAEAARSPVILGFSGVRLADPENLLRAEVMPPDPLPAYAALGLAVARSLTTPCCLLFNESPYLDLVLRSVELGFNLTMYADEALTTEELVAPVRQVVGVAHVAGAAVEAEMASVPGMSGELSAARAKAGPTMTDTLEAARFVERTGIDALAVNIGQMHLHGREEVRLDLARLAELRAAVTVPLVLHGATSVRRDDLRAAAALGIRKINVGSSLKRGYFEAMRAAAVAAGEDYTPYDVIGCGLPSDVLATGRLAMQPLVEEMMHLFGSAGKA